MLYVSFWQLSGCQHLCALGMLVHVCFSTTGLQAPCMLRIVIVVAWSLLWAWLVVQLPLRAALHQPIAGFEMIGEPLYPL